VKFCANDNNLVVSGGWDNNIKIWDIRQTNPIRSIFGPYICGDAIDLQDNFLLTGSYKEKNQLQLWDFHSCEEIETVPWDEGLPSDSPCLLYSA
jgi:WD40 repeat protein